MNKTAAFFFNSQALNLEQWICLLQERSEQIAPFLDKLTIPTVGDIQLRGGKWRDVDHPLSNDNPLVSTSVRKGLERQGIFVRMTPYSEPIKDTSLSKSGNLEYAGLSRSTKGWVAVYVECAFQGCWEIAKVVRVAELPLESIKQKDIQWVTRLWQGLGSAIITLCNEKRAMLRELFELERDLGLEHTFLEFHAEKLKK